MTPRRVDPINTPGRSAPNAHQQTLSSPKDSARAQLWVSLDGSEQRPAPLPPWGILPMMAGGGYQNVTSQRWESIYPAGQNVRLGFAVTWKNQNELFGQPNNSQGRIVPPPKQFRNVPSNIHVGKKNLSRTSPCWSYKHKIFLHILAWLECSRKALLWKSNEDYITYCLDWPRVVCHFETSYDQQQHRSQCLSCITSVRSSACCLPSVSVHRFKQMTTSWSFAAVRPKYVHTDMLISS